MSMPNRVLGKSRTWPLLAATSKSGPRYLLIVFALAGDSTITRFFFFRAPTDHSLRSRAKPQAAPAALAVVSFHVLATIAILGVAATHPYYTACQSVKPAAGSRRPGCRR